MLIHRAASLLSRSTLSSCSADFGGTGRLICRMNVAQLWTSVTNACEFSVTRTMLGVSNKELERDGVPQPEPLLIPHCRKHIRGMPVKMNICAKQIQRLPIEEAIKQMEFSPKGAATVVKEVLLEAQKIAVETYGVKDDTYLWVARSYVGKGHYLKRIKYHGRGRFGRMHLHYCHYFLILQEGPPMEKNRKRTSKYMTELDKITRFPREIRGALAWW